MKKYISEILSFVLLALGIWLRSHATDLFPFQGAELLYFLIAFLPVGVPVVKEAWECICEKEFFNEFTLMVLASIGAFYIGEYPEGVAVMLFYSVGEKLQDGAVSRARGHIRSLLDVRPETEQKEEDQFSTVNGFWDALTGCYMTMAGSDLYGERLMYSNIESLANQWYMPEDMTRYEDEDLSKHDYTTDYSRSAIEAMYSGLFSAIVQANMLIKYADERADVFTDESMRAVVQGEAYAIRAYCQFDVLRLFGQVPQGSRQVELPYSYTTSIYEMPAYYGFGKYVDLLKEDIAKALELLEKNDPLFEYSFAELNTNISLPDDHLRYRQSRLNYWVVKALEARLHLYVGETADAYRVAMEVINAKGPDGSSVMELSGQADLGSGYLAMPHECLFYVSKFDLHDEAWSILQVPEDQSFRPSTTLVITEDMYTDLYQDVQTTTYNRAGEMWRQTTEPGSSLYYYLLEKYAWDEENESSTMTTRQLLPMLRMAEVYLIAMEGAPSMTEANELYSIYMEDHGIAPTMLAPLADEQALKTFLLNEYRREFFGEGQMFYTYKRTNTADVQWMEAEMEEDYYILPLPETEYNPNNL